MHTRLALCLDLFLLGVVLASPAYAGHNIACTSDIVLALKAVPAKSTNPWYVVPGKVHELADKDKKECLKLCARYGVEAVRQLVARACSERSSLDCFATRYLLEAQVRCTPLGSGPLNLDRTRFLVVDACTRYDLGSTQAECPELSGLAAQLLKEFVGR